MNKPLVSIVMCSYNRTVMLRNALQSLVAQETNDEFTFEIVVVYGGDPGQSVPVIEDLGAESDVDIVGFYEARRGQVIARNRALELARGEWLAHFDDDQIADPTWLLELLRTARKQNTKVVGGALDLQLPSHTPPLSQQCRRMLGQSVTWDKVKAYSRKEGPGTGTVLIHRAVFDSVGDFDESFELRGYDTDLYRRIREAGFDAWFTPHSKAQHVIPQSRLTQEYFRETCLHNGWQFARRDILEWSILVAIVMFFLRAAHGLVFNGPRYIWSVIARSEQGTLTGKCRFWRIQGYGRSVLYSISPRIFAQETFFSLYEFRAERKAQELQSK